MAVDLSIDCHAFTEPTLTCCVAGRPHNEQATGLERRISEIAAHDDEQPERTNATELDALRIALRAALKDSAPTRTKAGLQSLIETIRVDACDHIEPTFRVPAVRVDYDYMEPTEVNANRFALLSGGDMALSDAE